jgi:hypothetical protein
VSSSKLIKEQELVNSARGNAALWEEIKERELEIEKRLADAVAQGRQVDDPETKLDPPLSPTLGEIARSLITERHGEAALESDEYPRTYSLIIELRRAALEDLGLPI